MLPTNRLTVFPEIFKTINPTNNPAISINTPDIIASVHAWSTSMRRTMYTTIAVTTKIAITRNISLLFSNCPTEISNFDCAAVSFSDVTFINVAAF